LTSKLLPSGIFFTGLQADNNIPLQTEIKKNIFLKRT